MFYQYFCSNDWAISAYLLLASIIGLWFLSSMVEVRLNDWDGRFFDKMQSAISAADGAKLDYYDHVKPLLIEWCILTTMRIFLFPTINWLTRRFAFQWREALTADYLFRWRSKMAGAAAASVVEGASQRVQEDCYKLSRMIDRLGQGVLNAVLQNVNFMPVLWRLSSNLPGLPNGILVYVAVGPSLVGYVVSYFVGYKLIELEYYNQATEVRAEPTLVRRARTSRASTDLASDLQTRTHKPPCPSLPVTAAGRLSQGARLHGGRG